MYEHIKCQLVSNQPGLVVKTVLLSAVAIILDRKSSYFILTSAMNRTETQSNSNNNNNKK